MRTPRRSRKPMSEINVVPFIDIMLVLLIVFMVTAPLITQGVLVDLPNTDAEPVDDSDQESLVVSIDEEGQYYINLGVVDTEEPQPVPLENIGDNVSRIMSQNPALPVYLEADETVNYGVVMSLMSTLEQAGAEGVRLITEPPE